MTHFRVLALQWLVAGSTLALSALAGAAASVDFLSAGCVDEGPSADCEVMFDPWFAGTGGFATGGYGCALSGAGLNGNPGGFVLRPNQPMTSLAYSVSLASNPVPL